jgi:putative oxidoreductase
MKIAALIARILMGLVFVLFGLNRFVRFLPPDPLHAGLAGQFLGALIESHYVYVVAALQLVGGALLLVNRYVPLALVILGPVIVNIFLFHLFMDRVGLPYAAILVVLWGIVAWQHRQAFAGLFARRAA